MAFRWIFFPCGQVQRPQSPQLYLNITYCRYPVRHLPPLEAVFHILQRSSPPTTMNPCKQSRYIAGRPTKESHSPCEYVPAARLVYFFSARPCTLQAIHCLRAAALGVQLCIHNFLIDVSTFWRDCCAVWDCSSKRFFFQSWLQFTLAFGPAPKHLSFGPAPIRLAFGPVPKLLAFRSAPKIMDIGPASACFENTFLVSSHNCEVVLDDFG